MVLVLFRSWPKNVFLTPKQLTIKTITILSLIGIPRKAEMHLFDLNYMADNTYFFTFDLAGPAKNVGEGENLSPLNSMPMMKIRSCVPWTALRTTLTSQNYGRRMVILVSFSLHIRNHITQQVSHWLDGLRKLYFLQMLTLRSSRHTP